MNCSSDEPMRAVPPAVRAVTAVAAPLAKSAVPTTTAESESNVMVALVERVADRVATGVPLGLALAGEKLSRAEYEEHLRRNPELAAHEAVAKRKFLQNAIKILLAGKDSAANMRWLLERLYPDVFGGQRESVTVNVAAVTGMSGISGMSEEYVKALQEDAKKL